MKLEVPHTQESASGMSVTITQYAGSYLHPSHIINVKSCMLEILHYLRMKPF